MFPWFGSAASRPAPPTRQPTPGSTSRDGRAPSPVSARDARPPDTLPRWERLRHPPAAAASQHPSSPLDDGSFSDGTAHSGAVTDREPPRSRRRAHARAPHAVSHRQLRSPSRSATPPPSHRQARSRALDGVAWAQPRHHRDDADDAASPSDAETPLSGVPPTPPSARSRYRAPPARPTPAAPLAPSQFTPRLDDLTRALSLMRALDERVAAGPPPGVTARPSQSAAMTLVYPPKALAEDAAMDPPVVAPLLAEYLDYAVALLSSSESAFVSATRLVDLLPKAVRAVAVVPADHPRGHLRGPPFQRGGVRLPTPHRSR